MYADKNVLQKNKYLIKNWNFWKIIFVSIQQENYWWTVKRSVI